MTILTRPHAASCVSQRVRHREAELVRFGGRKLLGLGLELRVCKPLGVDATVNQKLKEIPVQKGSDSFAMKAVGEGTFYGSDAVISLTVTASGKGSIGGP